MSRVQVEDVLDRRLGYALKRAQHALRIAMDEALRPLGVTTPQYAVLSAVQVEAGLTNAQLARSAFVTAQSMGGTLTNLERGGLLERGTTSRGGRELGCTLTAAGRSLVAEAHEAVAGIERVMMDIFGEDEADRVAGRLLECAAKLDAVRSA
jgi:DNA-binding MarR family transcriptional regulator